MALDIDAFTLLRAIAAEPSLFSGIRAEIAKETGKFTDRLRTLLVRQIKSDVGDREALRAIRNSVGAETFDLLVDGMKDGDLKTIVGRLDKHHPEQKTASAGWRRRHVRALLDGSAEPAHPPARKAKSARPKVAPAPKRRSSASPGKGKRGKQTAIEESEFLFDPSAGAVREK